MGKLLIDIRESDDENLYHFFTLNANLCVVDFYADWCGPCRRLSSELEQSLTKQEKIIEKLYVPTEKSAKVEDVLDKIVFLKVNIDNFKELAGLHKVQSIPHVIYYKNGELQSYISRSSTQISEVVNNLL